MVALGKRNREAALRQMIAVAVKGHDHLVAASEAYFAVGGKLESLGLC